MSPEHAQTIPMCLELISIQAHLRQTHPLGKALFFSFDFHSCQETADNLFLGKQPVYKDDAIQEYVCSKGLVDPLVDERAPPTLTFLPPLYPILPGEQVSPTFYSEINTI